MESGWVGKVRQWWKATKQLNPETPCDLKTPRTLEPILPAVCVKNFSAYFVPQPAENHTCVV